MQQSQAGEQKPAMDREALDSDIVQRHHDKDSTSMAFERGRYNWLYQVEKGTNIETYSLYYNNDEPLVAHIRPNDESREMDYQNAWLQAEVDGEWKTVGDNLSLGEALDKGDGYAFEYEAKRFFEDNPEPPGAKEPVGDFEKRSQEPETGKTAQEEARQGFRGQTGGRSQHPVRNAPNAGNDSMEM